MIYLYKFQIVYIKLALNIKINIFVNVKKKVIWKRLQY